MQATSQAQLGLWRGNISPIIVGNQARFELCFPRGYPVGQSLLRCFRRGWGGSIFDPTVPCLPPIVRGVLVPPCTGPYVAIINQYSEVFKWL